ncbi:hypothetical protein NQT62_13735 [Limnobacter humi]|uniref:Uncharacterized protein n=1 Tax=Limnobacter humi TaxID=1778671 RepID=A0ABT1WIZ3_9BURK|nr:hypothetical protein [Limnobacter humi]MCQ8897497.1 hypothetical protein [Limnobacter humi]
MRNTDRTDRLGRRALLLLLLVGAVLIGGVWGYLTRPAHSAVGLLEIGNTDWTEQQLHDKLQATLGSIQDPAVAFKALEDRRGESWIQPQESFEIASRELAKALSARELPNTNLIEIRLDTHRAAQWEQVLESAGDAWLSWLNIQNQTSTDQQIEALEEALRAKEREISAALLAEKSNLQQHTDSKALARLQQRERSLQAALEKTLKQTPDAGVQPPVAAQAAVYSQQVLLQRLKNRETQLLTQQQQLQADSPLADSLQSELNAVRLEMARLQEQVRSVQQKLDVDRSQLSATDRQSRIQALEQSLRQTREAIQAASTTTVENVAEPKRHSDQLFKELEQLDNQLIDAKKANAQLKLTWYKKPAQASIK